MNILVIGSGGREHCLAYKCSESNQVDTVFVMPGNPGMSDPKIVVSNLDPENFSLVKDFCLEKKIDLVIIGPEKYLSLGIVDYLTKYDICTFGPTKAASLVESSKIFSKLMMEKAQIPTAKFKSFNNAIELLKNMASLDCEIFKTGYVVKADILAQGKGVVVCNNLDEVKLAVTDLIQNKIIDENRDKILVESKLIGREVSAFAISDGEHCLPIGFACDYKRIRDNNEGPNTGGMGTYSPAYWLSSNEKIQNEINLRVFNPFIKALKAEGIIYRGVLFAGIMVNPKMDSFNVLEYNCRFGDPETQSLLPLIDEDLVPLFINASLGRLNREKIQVKLKKLNAIHVVMSAYGYPGTEGIAIKKGDIIKINSKLSLNSKLFFSGVDKDKDGNLVTNGGRVLGVTTVGENFSTIRETVYTDINKIEFYKKHFRTDIGL